MPLSTMRLAILQDPSPAGDAEAGFAALERALHAASAAGAVMLVGPELFLPGYNCADMAGLAQSRGGLWHQRLSAMTAETGCGLTIGYAEREDARVFNSAVTFDATGAEIAHYRKLQLYGPRESALFTAGDAYCIFDLAGRRAALLICYDVEFAPHLRALAEAGVDLILCPTANMLPFTHVSRLTLPANAVNHGLTIAYANFCGTEGDLSYCGGSVLVGADGAVLAAAGPGPALLIADLIAPDPCLLASQISDYRPVTPAPTGSARSAG